MLYIDSADVSAVARLLHTGLFDGITTNPTILRRADLTTKDIPALHDHALSHGARTTFFQAIGADAHALEAHGRELRELGDDVVVKIPATVPGYTAAAHLRAEGIPILLTAVYSASQGLLADALDCGWIAPYVGRITDLGHDGVAEVSTLSQMLRERRSSCRVLAASIRDVSQMTELAAAGVEDFTISTSICDALLESSHSISAAEAFEQDAAWHSP